MLQMFPPVLMWISLSFSQLRLLTYFSVSRLNIIRLLASIKFVMFLPVTVYRVCMHASLLLQYWLYGVSWETVWQIVVSLPHTLLYVHLVFIRWLKSQIHFIHSWFSVMFVLKQLLQSFSTLSISSLSKWTLVAIPSDRVSEVLGPTGTGRMWKLHTENSNPEAGGLCEVACGGKRSSQTGALNQSQSHLCQRPLPVHQPIGDEVYEPVSVSEVGTQRMAQVVVGTNISKHRHQTCKHSNTLVTLIWSPS